VVGSSDAAAAQLTRTSARRDRQRERKRRSNEGRQRGVEDELNFESD